MKLYHSVAGALIVVGALVVFSMRAQAATGVEVAPARIDVSFKPDAGTLAIDLKVTNRSDYRDTFTVTPVDLVVRDNTPYPAGATPYGTSAHITLTMATLMLDPKQVATVRATFDVSQHRPLFGGILVTPQVSSKPGVYAIPSVLVPITLAPLDSNGQLAGVDLALTPTHLDVPSVMESGPISVKASLRNSGSFFERAYSTFTYSSFGHPFLVVNAPPGDALPGQLAVTGATTRQRLEATGQTVDTAPLACWCTITVQTYAQLGDQQTVVPVVQTATVIVLPWRLAGLVLAVVFGATIGARRARRR